MIKLNQVIFWNENDFKKITKNTKIYDLLSITNKKPMKKYKEIQKKYLWYVLVIQIWCFYKIFDKEAIFLSKELWLKLTIFNPKTNWERIMCGFHEKSIEKYKLLIKQKQINSIFLKQNKDKKWNIEREINEIFEFENNLKSPIFSKKDIEQIKADYYKTYFWNKKISSITTIVNDKENEFINDFKNTDFSKKSFYEIIEYIINWKKLFLKYNAFG